MAAKVDKLGPSPHTAGIYADMTLDGPEIGTLVAVVDRAKNLPNRKSMSKQDPYCAMRLGKEAKKTGTDKRGGQTPRWDQELRFTVHESPDYYKLKVSIFNDDKKTDLIGESWVDLKSVITPGGGQSDLWHQLQYRGKYAGEVRIELTYYDIRPPDASVLSKRGQVENPKLAVEHKTATKATNGNEPKHFGPRGIRRRPLPPDPTGQPPSRPPMPEIHSSPIPHTQGYGLQESNGVSWAPDRDVHKTNDHMDQEEDSSQENPFDFELPRERIQLRSAQQSDRYQNSQTASRSFDDYQTPPRVGFQDNSDGGEYGSHYTASDSFHYGNLDLEERRHSAQPAIPSQDRQYHNASSAYGSSPPIQESFRPSEAQNDIRQRAQLNRFSTSPIKNDVFKDSPLKQSMSHADFSATYEEPRDMNEDEAPPPPPVHRSSGDRGLPSSRSFQNMQAVPMPEPLNISSTSVRTLPDIKSPLQHIERACDPLVQKATPKTSPSSDRNSGYVAYSKPTYTPDFTRSRGRSDASPSFPGGMPQSLRSGYQSTMVDIAAESDVSPGQNYNPYFRDSKPLSYGSSPGNRPPQITRDREDFRPDQPNSYQTPDRSGFIRDSPTITPDRDREIYGSSHLNSVSSRDQEVYGDQRSSSIMTPSGYTNRRPQSSQGSTANGGSYQRSVNDRRGSSDPYQLAQNGAPIYQARGASVNDRDIYTVPSRKSVSPNFTAEPSPSPERRLSGIPFSPDSYDILNPSTAPNSAATAPSHPRYETPDQAAEAARQREVEKLRDVGPIIGNDGRVIDPSDHLPTDTWAPEPERKAKKPEVVIRFKTGNNSSNSNVATPRTPQSGRPTPSPRVQSMYGSSPGPVDTPSYGGENVRSGGRNRLQKSNPSRPLPTQPYATSSPAVPLSSSPYHTPSPRNPARSSISEYPLRENHNFGNSSPYGGGLRNGGPGWAPPRPAKVPLSAEDAGMDALAMEMQSIDIGVGRGPRTRRGY